MKKDNETAPVANVPNVPDPERVAQAKSVKPPKVEKLTHLGPCGEEPCGGGPGRD